MDIQTHSAENFFSVDKNVGENQGVPDFFIETILRKLPSKAKDDNSKCDQFGVKSHAQHDNLKADKLISTLHRPTSNSSFCFKQRFDLSNPSPGKKTLTNDQIYGFKNDANSGFLHNFNFRQNLLHLRQQLYHSAYRNNISAMSSLLCRGFGGITSVNSLFRSPSQPSVSHFELWANGGSVLRSDKNYNLNYEPQLSNNKLQNDFRKTEASSSLKCNEARDILMQLNRLSEKISLQKPGEIFTSKRRKSLDKKNHKKGPQPIQSFQVDSVLTQSPSSSQTNREFEKVPTRDDSEHPAWVFCTRYSDRPCAGPRIRRAKKDDLKCRTPTTSKRERIAFSEMQLEKLQREFNDCPYLTEERRVNLSKDLGLSVSQIKVWFQNKRAKVKKASGVQSRLKIGLIESGIYEHGTVVMENKE